MSLIKKHWYLQRKHEVISDNTRIIHLRDGTKIHIYTHPGPASDSRHLEIEVEGTQFTHLSVKRKART